MNAAARRVLRKIIPTRVVKSIGMPSDPDRYSCKRWTYNEDGLATEHNCDFMQDQLFLESYGLGERTGSWRGAKPHWRAYVCCWAAEKAKTLEGDFVECGVNKGGYALTVMNYTGFRNLEKRFYLLDTFSGFVDKYITDEERKLGRRAGTKFEECHEDVVRTFKGWNAVIVRGAVPETLPLVESKKVCYLSIDMNCVIPEIAAAEFFWDKLVSGAVMVLDDYGWAGHHLQKRAFDRFASDRRVSVLSLPTGQGLVLKP